MIPIAMPAVRQPIDEDDTILTWQNHPVVAAPGYQMGYGQACYG
jgi:hypothetical protein